MASLWTSARSIFICLSMLSTLHVRQLELVRVYRSLSEAIPWLKRHFGGTVVIVRAMAAALPRVATFAASLQANPSAFHGTVNEIRVSADYVGIYFVMVGQGQTAWCHVTLLNGRASAAHGNAKPKTVRNFIARVAEAM